MDEFSFEILSMIFDLSSLEEKLKLREVCKKFLFVIDKQTEKSLMIKRESSSFGVTWFDNFKLVSSKNLINYDQNRSIFDSNFFGSRFFINLKKLHLRYGLDSFLPGYLCETIREREITFLNNFQQLETLYINLRHAVMLNSESKEMPRIKLNELKNLCVDQNLGFPIGLSFDCPKLRFISALTLITLEIVNPKTITQVETLPQDKELPRLERFINLEYFHSNTGCYREQHIKALITQSPNLKFLRVPQPKTKNELIELRQFLKKRRRPIDVYVGGLPIDHWIPQCWDNLDLLKFYFDNNQFLKISTDIHSVNYENWQKLEAGRELPATFQSRLVNLSEVEVTKKIVNVDHFVKFIVNCKMLQSLTLNNSSLEKEFYSNLPNYLHYLSSLSISDDEDLLAQIEFSFLFKLRDLFDFEINHPLNLSFIRELVLKNTKLKYIKVFCEGQHLNFRF